MSDRLRSRRRCGGRSSMLLLLGGLAELGPVVRAFRAQPSRHPTGPTFVTVRTSATCSTSGRRSPDQARPDRRRWSSSSTAAGSAAATSRACRPGWCATAWTRGSRSPRRTIGYRRRRRFPHRCSTVRGRFSSCDGTQSSWESTPIGSPHRAARPARGLRSGSGSTTTWPTRQQRSRRAQSSRVCCVGVDGAQTSYDPRFIKSLIGGRAHEHPALRPFYGIKSDAEMDSPRIHKLFEEASPLNYVTSDDPPAILFYAEPDAPLPADAKPGKGIHHPRFGRALKSKLDPLGVECVLRHWNEYPKQDDPVEAMCRDMTTFFTQGFQTGR